MRHSKNNSIVPCKDPEAPNRFRTSIGTEYKCKPDILPGNKYANELIEMYGNVLLKNGLVDVDTIRFIFEMEGIPSEKQGLLFQKLLIYGNTVLNMLNDRVRKQNSGSVDIPIKGKKNAKR